MTISKLISAATVAMLSLSTSATPPTVPERQPSSSQKSKKFINQLENNPLDKEMRLFDLFERFDSDDQKQIKNLMLEEFSKNLSQLKAVDSSRLYLDAGYAKSDIESFQNFLISLKHKVSSNQVGFADLTEIAINLKKIKDIIKSSVVKS